METIKVTYQTHKWSVMSNAGIVLNVFVHDTHSIDLTLDICLCALRGKCIGLCLHFLSLESIVFIFTNTYVVNGNHAWCNSTSIGTIVV